MTTQLWQARIRLGGLVMTAIIFALAFASRGQAETFSCASGNAGCLIAAINAANANGQENTITLAAGTYTLTAVDNTTHGANGLPSVTSPLTIRGAGAETTIVARAAGAPDFRLVHVAASGALTLDRLTIKDGQIIGGHPAGGLYNAGGTFTLVKSTLARNRYGFAGFGPGGGGLCNDQGTVTLTNSTLTGNGAGSGGGAASAIVARQPCRTPFSPATGRACCSPLVQGPIVPARSRH